MNPKGNVANLRPFAPGQSGNPGGKPVAARNRLQGDFVDALADDFAVHGRAAIVRCREQAPGEYVRIIVSILPKQVDIGHPFDDISDDELSAMLEVLRAIIAEQRQPSKDAQPAAAA